MLIDQVPVKELNNTFGDQPFLPEGFEFIYDVFLTELIFIVKR